jgi:phosphoribosylaminoimidazolecarboxamide formyltransferase/IMP cyclohydrolase
MRALLSVSDKTNLIELATRLHNNGVELISTGGTQKALEASGLPVKNISAITGFPEILDGRVKTLHPNVHGGLLGKSNLESHLQRQVLQDLFMERFLAR